MKSTIKLALVITLFSSAVFAEGDMGTGGRTCPNGQTTCCPNNQTTCLVNYEVPQNEETTTDSDSLLSTVQEYWNSMFEYFEN